MFYCITSAKKERDPYLLWFVVLKTVTTSWSVAFFTFCKDGRLVLSLTCLMLLVAVLPVGLLKQVTQQIY